MDSASTGNRCSLPAADDGRIPSPTPLSLRVVEGSKLMDTTDETSPPVLSVAEARVLGCLIEKEATTPDAYPLTVNAAHVAANQKTARDPVMALNVGDVNHALRSLEQKGFAKQVFSSRAERYEHHAGKALDLPRQQVALLGLLLLRGPQTVHELLARSERLVPFADA